MKDDLLHGGALDRMRAAFPDAPEPWADLSTGVNPWPYPDTAIDAAALRHLPDNAAMDACRAAMAAAFATPADSLLLAPGSELLIRMLPNAIAPKRVVILSPTYGDHARVWRAAGVDVTETNAPLAHADTADAVVLCNPNNPDGRVFDRQDLDTARRRLAARGGWLIVDEAYADINPDLSLAPMGGGDGLVILRSMGKFFGLAGLRLGALIAPKSVQHAMAERLGVWPVSGPALAIGRRAYQGTAWADDMRAQLSEARRRLDAVLKAGGLSITGGTDLFRYVETDNAHALWAQLARAGLYVRRFPWSERHLRIGLPASADVETRLAAALTPSS
ncbi:MAG: threonine-phosphate decarboxylase CobD [Pseudomonadota bacterium]